MAKIEDVISMLEREIILLKYKNEVNVTKRIDEVVKFLEETLDVAKATQEGQKFDLTQTGSNCIFTYLVGTTPVAAGSNVLAYGDDLKITVTPSTGYDLTSLKVNGKNFTNGSTIKVTDNILVEAVTTIQTYDLSNTLSSNLSVEYEIGGEAVTVGTDKLTYGDVLKITVTPDTGYDVSTLTVNGNAFVSGNSITVSSDVVVVAEATLKKFDLNETISENCTVAYLVDSESVSAGTDVLTYGDELTITATPNDGYSVSLTVNGNAFISGNSIVVTGDVTVVAETTAL